MICRSNQVLIRPDVSEDKVSSSGIIYEKKDEINTNKISLRGEVVQVGDKVEDVKVGNRVIFTKQSALNFIDKEHILISERSILGILL